MKPEPWLYMVAQGSSRARKMMAFPLLSVQPPLQLEHLTLLRPRKHNWTLLLRRKVTTGKSLLPEAKNVKLSSLHTHRILLFPALNADMTAGAMEPSCNRHRKAIRTSSGFGPHRHFTEKQTSLPYQEGFVKAKFMWRVFISWGMHTDYHPYVQVGVCEQGVVTLK